MPARIVFIGYKRIIDLVASQNLGNDAEVSFIIREGLLDTALEAAKRVEARGEAEVFMSSGANALMIRRYIKTPLVEVRITGFDLLLALKKLDRNLPIAVLTFQEQLQFLSEVEDLLKPRIIPITFDTEYELDDILKRLLEKGVHQVVGGSLVVERARIYGLKSSFIYSADGVMRAYEAAREMAISCRRVLEHSSKLDAIIKFAHDGIVATDPSGIISVFNPSAAHITNVPSEKALGCNVADVLPNSRMMHVMRTGRQELNQIQKLHGVDILTNRIPMLGQKGEILGCVVNFQDTRAIQTAEAKIRHQAGKAFKAKIHMEDILGDSEEMARCKQKAMSFARSDSVVLIMGETGTGKEYFAQGIHLASARAARPFVGINCAALPRDLLESELFGYAEGAFTGAKRGGRTGLFELAHQGTVFLDEISEMPLDIQGRLLRVLQEREVLRIGDEQVIKVDIRVMAATNKNLWNLVQQGLFRQDLYYRLCVLRLHLPPLRERRGDIPLLINHFLGRLEVDMRDQDRQLLASHPWLFSHSWPGNVRELLNFVESVSALYDGSDRFPSVLDEVVQATMKDKQAGAPPGWSAVAMPPAPERPSLDAPWRKLNKAELARALGISRTTLWRRTRQQQN